MEQSTTLSLFHVDEIMFPFIEGSFVCKTGKVLEGFFLIDTGSTENMFNYEAIHTLADENFIGDSKKYQLSTIRVRIVAWHTSTSR